MLPSTKVIPRLLTVCDPVDKSPPDKLYTLLLPLSVPAVPINFICDVYVALNSSARL